VADAARADLLLGLVAGALRQGRPAEALAPARAAVSLRRSLAVSDPDQFAGLYGESLVMLSDALAKVGEPVDALAAAREAVSVLRATSPDEHRHRNPLVRALENLSLRLADAGRDEEAVTPAAETTALFRELVAADRRHRYPLARTLSFQFNLLARLERAEEALAPAREAVAVLEVLAAEKPGELRWHLAHELSALTSLLARTHHGTEAIQVGERAVACARDLVADRPDGHRELAPALFNLAVCLLEADQPARAIPLFRECVTSYRAQAEPAAPTNQAGIARAMNNLAKCLGAVGQHEQAVEPAQAAVGLFEALAASDPGTYRSDVARTTGNLATVLSAVGRYEQAVELSRRSVGLYRRVVELRAGEHRADLALALNMLANRLGDVGLVDEALDAAAESVRLRRELVQEDLDAHAAGLALSLSNLSTHLSQLGQHDRALATTQEAIDLSRRVRGVPEHTLVLCLLNMAADLASLDRREEAVTASLEAVRRCADLDERTPGAAAATCALALSSHARLLLEAGWWEEAQPVMEAGLARRRALARRLPEVHLPWLARELLAASHLLRQRGAVGAARVAATEAVRLARPLAESRPRLCQTDLIAGLVELGAALSDGSEGDARHAEAVAALREAAVLCRALSAASPLAHRPRLAWVLLELGGALAAAGGTDEALASFAEVLRMADASERVRVDAAQSAGRLLLATGQAEQALARYEQAVSLLPASVPRGWRRRDRELGLRALTYLGPEAAAAAIATGRTERAVELLERTRGVLFADALDPRGDLARLRAEAPELAAELAAVQDALDVLDGDSVLGMLAGPEGEIILGGPPPEVAAQRAQARRRQLEARRDEVVAKIRARSGFARFHQRAPYRELADQARHGAIVVLNAAGSRCDALLLTHGSAGPTIRHLPLDVTADQLRDWAFGRAEHGPVLGTAAGDRRLSALLAWLWDHVAQPVLDELGHRATPEPDASWPRVWWCLTGQFSLLPVHAAGRHGDRRQGSTVLDRVISSCTPTLTALAHARAAQGRLESGEGQTTSTACRTLLVSMPDTPDMGTLPNVRVEAEHISRLVPGASRLAGAAATRERLLAELPQHQVAHFACHGVSHLVEPSQSHLLLHDHRVAPVTVLALSRLRLLDARLAYLSACSTAVVSTALLSEALHVTAALQLAGFAQVIGTLWEINDLVAAEVARAVYTTMTGDGAFAPRTWLAAQALHTTVRTLRDDDPTRPHLWAAYIHSGA
jgi:tetratricopeptide (TPR) repeat protein